MSEAVKEIVILMYQYSVVVKGIERKLQDSEYAVTTVAEDLDEQVKRFAGKVELFLFYLPGDIYDDTIKRKKLQHLTEFIAETHQKMILVGEPKYYDDLLGEIPALRQYTWLNRPLDMNVLTLKVEAEILRKEEVRKKSRILIVDDDPSFAKMVREWIKDLYRVDIVTAGMQAITFLVKAAEDEQVDLILLDYEMPVVDGPQVLQMLRQEEATAHIPVIFLTGVGTKEAVSRVMSLKPDGYLLKTTPRTEILEYLKKKLG
ncbi:MAG: response regulator [Lachnospiraceae bacterium]|nr:response regulator [Lachnospiraceae bacterium]